MSISHVFRCVQKIEGSDRSKKEVREDISCKSQCTQHCEDQCGLRKSCDKARLTHSGHPRDEALDVKQLATAAIVMLFGIVISSFLFLGELCSRSPNISEIQYEEDENKDDKQ